MLGTSSKNVGHFSKNLGRFSKNVGDFPKNVGVFFPHHGERKLTGRKQWIAIYIRLVQSTNKRAAFC
jgi:hypothetical protein